jgi:hypothetical protein
MTLFKDKKWYESITFWGATGFALVGVLEAYSVMNPELAPIAQGLAAFLIAIGIRRHLK